MNSIEKYLSNYAEPETRLVEALIQNLKGIHRREARLWQYALVIPAYQEKPDFFLNLKSRQLSNYSALLILVINQPCTDPTPNALNTLLLDCVNQHSELLAAYDNLSLRRVHHTNSAVLLINRFAKNRGIPHKQGVGLARKIGADIATALIHQGQIAEPWIFSTDADTHLPSDYFPAAKAATGKPGLIYPFNHRCSPGCLGNATRLYEASLNYYVAGLAYAGSPYAFHTLGSTLAIDYRAYAKARGFPKRAGGEDFYLLNKLAKLGSLHQLSAPVLEIEARQSDRVPFGTGPAISRLLDYQRLVEAPVFYHPSLFEALKQWLSCATALFPNYQFPPELSGPIQRVLVDLGVESMLTHASKQCKTAAQFERQLHIWFDSFRTLKFIHGLRENGLPKLSLSELLEFRKTSPDVCYALFQSLPDLVIDRLTGSR